MFSGNTEECLASVWFFLPEGMSKNRGDKTSFARRTSLYRIGLVILLKNIFEFIIGLDQL